MVEVTKMMVGMLALNNDSVLGAWSGAVGESAVLAGGLGFVAVMTEVTVTILTRFVRWVVVVYARNGWNLRERGEGLESSTSKYKLHRRLRKFADCKTQSSNRK